MATLNGTSSSETINGTASADTINGMAGHDDLFGNGGNDVIDGGNGNDFINGGLGDDILIGGAGYNDLNGAGGADIYRMSNRVGAAFSDDLVYDMTDDDLVDVSAWGISDFSQVQAIMGINYYGAAIDAYYNGVHHVLSFLDVHPSQFEESDFVYSTALGGTQNGTALQDTLFGSTGNDTLNGLGSRDRLLGGLGNDALNGGDGDDDLIGGAGRDVMSGGSGYDWYMFDNATDSGVGALARDVISDFTRGQDMIDVCDIDANSLVAGNQAFVWRGGNAFTGAGQARYVQVDGNTIIQFSTDADKAAEFEIQLTGTFTLGASDFIL